MHLAHKRLLILPGGFGEGPAHRDFAMSLGVDVIGASSVKDDPAAVGYPEWVFLPHIADPDFGAALATLIADARIDHIHVTHDIVLDHLRKLAPAIAPAVTISHGRTLFDMDADYRRLIAQAEQRPAIPALEQATAAREALTTVEMAGYLRAVMSIPGQSEIDKLMALAEAARRAPEGDIVEIGSFLGRTAAFFSLLAGRYGLGKVLCVDPWEVEAIDQDAEALKQSAQIFDWAYWREVFEVNVAPFAQGRLNYIHAYSTEGARIYATGAPVMTEAFGETQYTGQIGLLYIDGNHAYESVRADCESWGGHVSAGGWIVFDDYEWGWGDGVRRAADAFVAALGERARCSFVAGKALFVQLR